MKESGGFKSQFQRIKHRLQSWRWYRPLHLAYTGWRAYHLGLPDWAAVRGSSGFSYAKTTNGSVGIASRVLIATGTGGHLPSATIESLLGVALSLRGAEVEFLLCDGVLPACMLCEINWYSDVESFTQRGPVDRCRYCHGPAARMLEGAGFRHLGLGKTLLASERSQARSLAQSITIEEIRNYKANGVLVGEHAMAGALRFFARGELESKASTQGVLRRYFEAALLTEQATRKVLAAGRYQVLLLNHGIYVPQGIVAETARTQGIRVVTWHPAYRKRCFIFSHEQTYHHALMTERTDAWENMAWDDRQRQDIQEYLRSRWEGSEDWIRFHRAPQLDCHVIERETGIDFSQPTIGLLTNVVWDAQLHYPANAFPSMLDWLLKTITYFARRQDLQLLIRIHPAELTGTLPSRQLAADEIRNAFPTLPPNIFLIEPQSRLSTYVAMSNCNAAIIYGTKTGVELAATGIPVVVAGEAWIRGKGVTMDAASEADYFRILDNLPVPNRLDEAKRERALRYAYHFFFRRMIPLDCVREKRGWPPFGLNIDKIPDLMPGRSVGLDLVCQGILEGTPFIYPAERLRH